MYDEVYALLKEFRLENPQLVKALYSFKKGASSPDGQGKIPRSLLTEFAQNPRPKYKAFPP